MTVAYLGEGAATAVEKDDAVGVRLPVKGAAASPFSVAPSARVKVIGQRDEAGGGVGGLRHVQRDWISQARAHTAAFQPLTLSLSTYASAYEHTRKQV